MPKRYIVTNDPGPTPGTRTLKFKLVKPDATDMCPDLPPSLDASDDVGQHFKDPQKHWSCSEIRHILDQG